MSVEFKNNISAVIESMNNNKIKALAYTGAFIVEEAKKQCPVDTGALRDSIKYEIKDNKVILTVGTNYGIFVHEGTYKMEARRFLYNAVYQNTHLIKIS
jgi:HK97 gp10 family phage protein